MSLFTLLRVALRLLRRNKLRSALTVLGIVIGVAAVIAMVALGRGAQSNVASQIASLGANLILVLPGATQTAGVKGAQGSSSNLTRGDIAALGREVPTISAVAPTNRVSGQIVYGDANWSTSIFGSTPAYFDVRQWKVARGATFGDGEELTAAKVCVIGQTVADNLFGDQDPIGQTVRARNVPLRVIGVLEPKGQSVMGNDQDDTVLVPLATLQQRMIGGSRETVGTALVAATGPDTIDAAMADMRAVLRQRHHLQPDDDDDFSLRNMQDIAKANAEVADVLTVLLGAVAGVSLLVGGIGVMNIMLVSVTERTREIGIRMSVGARSRDILLQFLVEAVALSTLGGALGIGIGAIAASVLQRTTGWPTLFDPQTAAVAVAVSASIGVFFGFYPARTASRLDPVEALRHE